MKLEMPVGITSPQDLKSIILELRSYANWFSQNNIKMNISNVGTGNLPNISEATTILLKVWGNEEPVTQNKLDELIKTLGDLLVTSPHMSITLAAAPANNLKIALLSWCRTNIDPNILIDFRFKSTLLGGMVVRYGSHVYDWSFRRQILESRGKFPEVLRRV